MADRPYREAGDPEAQAQPDRACQRPVDDGERARAPPSNIGSVSARWTGAK
jgi:hypothetical protein